MCGIAGALGFFPDGFIDEAISCIRHRGPDHIGKFTANKITLGYSRLAINDLSESGNQPKVSAGNRFVIVFNGEIYNHNDLRRQLEYKYEFISLSDTETLLHGYEEWREELFSKLNGIFAIAIYDKEEEKLILARDPFGVKPLYYFCDTDSFIFGSEIKAILNHPGLKTTINKEALIDHIGLLYSLNNKTIFSGINKLQPGSYTIIQSKNLQEFHTSRFYSNTFKPKLEISYKDAIQNLHKKLKKALEMQLKADVPVAFLLSGGLDSSGLVALARAVFPKRKLTCFTTGQGKTEVNSDLTFARVVAKNLNVELIEVEPVENYFENLTELATYLEEPIGDPAAFQLLAISKKAKEMGFKVLISGTGADELLAGYRRHKLVKIQNIINTVADFILKTSAQISRNIPANNSFIRKFKKAFSEIDLPEKERLLHSLFWLAPDIVSGLTGETKYSSVNGLIKQWENSSGSTSLEKLLDIDQNNYLTENNLLYNDKCGMAAGIEIRVPYLDLDVVNFINVLPSDFKNNKNILRAVLKNYLPHEILNRSKTGFGLSIRNWAKENIQYFETEEFKRFLQIVGIEENGFEKLIKDFKKNKLDVAYSLFALLLLKELVKEFEVS